MPVKLGGHLPQNHAEARIEIVPLIDIMFFLLASFMLVSLSMVNLRSVKLNLPTATTAAPDVNHDLIDVAVDRSGRIYLDKVPLRDSQIVAALTKKYQLNSRTRVLVSGDKEARHGDFIHALDLVRLAGIDKIAVDTGVPHSAVQ